MKRNDRCLPCLVNQMIKVADMVNATNKEQLYHQVFAYLSQVDFEKTNPEMIGDTFALIKAHIGNDDPYQDVRNDYNQLFLKEFDHFDQLIHASHDPFYEAIRYAIVGNIIDFNPMHNHDMEDIMKYFDHMHEQTLVIDKTQELKKDLLYAKTLLYLGDNCGEICLDKLLIKEIHRLNPQLHIYFAVRGVPVVNDSIAEDAYRVGMDEYATVIENGDQSLGTVLSRTSQEFQDIYQQADVIISKGQANYECLSEENHNIYFLLMSKCEVIAEDIGVPQKSMICLHKKI